MIFFKNIHLLNVLICFHFIKTLLKTVFWFIFYYLNNNCNEMSLHRIYKAFPNQSLIQYIVTFLYRTDAIADCSNALNTASVFCCPSCLIGANLILMRLISHQVSKVTRWSLSSECSVHSPFGDFEIAISSNYDGGVRTTLVRSSLVKVCHSSAFQTISDRLIYIKIINYSGSILANLYNTMQAKQHASKKKHTHIQI